MADEMDPATVLEEAADLLLIHGRCKGQLRDDDGRFCVIGAITAATGIDVKQDSYLEAGEVMQGAAVAAVVPWIGSGSAQVWQWSDRTTDDFEVIDTLRLVAKDLRNAAVV